MLVSLLRNYIISSYQRNQIYINPYRYHIIDVTRMTNSRQFVAIKLC